MAFKARHHSRTPIETSSTTGCLQMALGSPQAGKIFESSLPVLHLPSRTRYWVLFLAFLVTMLTYLDRVCISVAAPGLSKDLHLSRMEMGYVFGVFELAYATFGIPVSWQGDRAGQRKLLTSIVACWSALTVITGLSRGYFALLGIRFAFGAAESGAFPTLSRALAKWFPQSERARANGVLWMGARLGGSLAPALAMLCIALFGWRTMFVIFGGVSAVWCLVFWRWYRDDPADHPSVNALELAYIRGDALTDDLVRERSGPTPWNRIFSSGNLWALFSMYFCSAYGFQFFITWLPTFLIKDRGLTLQRSGVYSALPLASGTLGCFLGGALSDRLAPAIGSLKWARRLIGLAGFLLAAIGFGLAGIASNPLTATLLLTISAGAHDLMLPVAWATCVDIGGRFGATTSSFMNTGASLSGMLSAVSAAWLASRFGSFNSVLAVVAATYVIGGLLWLRIDPEHSISA